MLPEQGYFRMQAFAAIDDHACVVELAQKLSVRLTRSDGADGRVGDQHVAGA